MIGRHFFRRVDQFRARFFVRQLSRCVVISCLNQRTREDRLCGFLRVRLALPFMANDIDVSSGVGGACGVSDAKLARLSPLLAKLVSLTTDSNSELSCRWITTRSWSSLFINQSRRIKLARFSSLALFGSKILGVEDRLLQLLQRFSFQVQSRQLEWPHSLTAGELDACSYENGVLQSEQKSLRLTRLSQNMSIIFSISKYALR